MERKNKRCRAINNGSINSIPLMVSEQGAADLMKILLDRGYFHEQGGAIASQDEPLKVYNKSDATVIQTNYGTFITRDCLTDKLSKEIESFGRIQVSQAAIVLGVSESEIRKSLVDLTTATANKAAANPVVVWVGEEAMSHSYLDETVNAIVTLLHLSEGKALVSEIAHDVLQLPLETTLTILRERLPEEGGEMQIKMQQNGSKVLVTSTYLEFFRARTHGAFLAMTQPTHVEQFAHDRGLEPSWVLEFLQDDKMALALPGELHGDNYIPTCFTQQQKLGVVRFFTANGFMTTTQCHSFGVLLSEMKMFVTEACPSAIVLKESVVHPDIIASSLEALIQEAIGAESWIDLQTHLPFDLLAREEDAKILLYDHVLPSVDPKGNAGLVSLSSDSAIFMSRGIIDKISETLLPPLVESCALIRAMELDQSGNKVIRRPSDKSPPAKEKRKAKKSTAAKPKQAALVVSSDNSVVPLDTLVKAVVEAYPELAEQKTTLPSLCERAFYTDDFASTCDRAVQAELQRLESNRASNKVRHSHKDAASSIKNIEASFEDNSCFATACYMIQGMASFLEYAATAADNDEAGLLQEDVLNEITTDFLRGCCADFTRRVTQYCLFKHEVDEISFFFRQEGNDAAGDDDNETHFCSPVNLATRRYRPVFLSCEDDEESKPREPLPTLRKVLPSTVGTALARQWILCGGACYQGGNNRPGDLEGFLAHAEENALTICQLPFKQLDKKAKKGFLHSRRQLLTQLLEDETNPQAVLDFSVMLLFQLVKNHVVFGSHLSGPILQLLTRERKISKEVSTELLNLAEKIDSDSGNKVDHKIVERVKACALGRQKS